MKSRKQSKKCSSKAKINQFEASSNQHLQKLLKEERYEEAEPLFDKFVAGKSPHKVGYDNFISYARLKSKRGRNGDAEKAAMFAISVDELRLDAPEFLLELYLKQKLFSKAMVVADRLLDACPDSIDYRTNRLTVMSNLQKSDEVIEEWNAICEIDHEKATNPSVLHTVLHALIEAGRIDEAADYFLEFKKWYPEWSQWLALSEPHIYFGVGEYAKAIDSLTESMEKDPKNPVWQWNRGLIRLAKGDLVEGWKDYEVRWDWEDFPSPKRNLDLPLWKGEDLANKSIVVSAEQGLGDQIMFSSILVALLNLSPRKVRIEVQDKAVPLFELWYPDCEIASWKNDPSTDAQLVEEFDFHCPMATVCGLLMSSERAISRLPRRKLKLGITEQQSLLGSFGGDYDIKIGLSWRSSAVDGQRASHYMNVNLCEAIIEALPKSIGFVVVQYKFNDDERNKLRKYPNVFIPEEELFDDVLLNAKYCASCDLVVSPATMVVQLCGLFGVPVLSWGAERSWVHLGFDQPPWHGSIHQIKHKPNMAKGEMVRKLINVLENALIRETEAAVC